MISIDKWIALFNSASDNVAISEQEGDNPFGKMTILRKQVNTNGIEVTVTAARIEIGYLTTILFSTENFEYTLVMTAKQAWNLGKGQKPYILQYGDSLRLTVIPYKTPTISDYTIKTTQELADEELALISLRYEDVSG